MFLLWMGEGWGGGGGAEIRTCTTCCLRDITDMETVFYIQIRIVANAKGGPNYTMIRRAIFGKVHGHGV